MKTDIIARYLFLTGLVWTLVCAVAVTLHLQQDRLEAQRQVLIRAGAELDGGLLSAHAGADCLKCHAGQNEKKIDTLGGQNVIPPLEPASATFHDHRLLSVGLFALLWVAGSLSLYLLGRKLYLQTQLAAESDRQRLQVEENLSFVSNYDRRSRLPNRFKFEEELAALFREAGRQGDAVVVAVLEIRNYRQIVDNFDHPVGDLLFRLVADRLTGLLDGEGAAARFGEDRLLFSCRGPAVRFEEGGLLQKVLADLGRPLILEGLEFYPVVCLGAAFYPDDGIDAGQVVRRAVTAMTSILDSRQSGLRLYCDSLQIEARDRLEIERRLRRALADDSFELYLQPQVNAISGTLIGAEALLRWQPTEGVFVPPASFIPVAEEQGLILPIGEWVLLTACRRAAQLKKSCGRGIPIAVNVSASQFQDPGFIDMIDRALATEGMSPSLLEVEITEGTFFKNVDRTIEILVDLKSRGVQIAIDDFGTGFSSLSYLKRFPLDCLKIDRSFVEDIAVSEDDRVIVALIAEMGRKLGLRVIAEGVETDVQKHLLLGMQCQSMQGVLFSRPLPFEDFCRYLEGSPPD